ncbi:flagellin [Thiomicrorhabdus arctica]|uniref:flagellin n=1 Tax=Thiomicrorhabdus arctica TaxID=131540 RepID=UPI000476511F|nr:flagellin [Thiomicrorhabdus arctica]
MDISAYSTTNNPSHSSNLQSINESMASGSKINHSSDNPAAQAIITALTTRVDTQDMATRNANDGISLLQTADSASNSITQSLQRMNELSIQSMNGTLNPSQRSMLNQEFQQNLQSINQVSDSTSFNGNKLLNGNTTGIDIALGDTTSRLTLPNLSTDALSITGLDISNPASASLAMDGVSLAIEQLSSARSQFGAQQNGLTSAVDNQQNQSLNTMATRSQLSDTDFARTIAEQSRLNILNQSSIAMMSQGTQSKSSVLQLLGT